MTQFLKTLPLSFFRTVSSRPIFHSTSLHFWTKSFSPIVPNTWQNLVGARLLHKESQNKKLLRTNVRVNGIARKLSSKKSKKKCGKLKCRIVAREGGKATIDCTEDNPDGKKDSTGAQSKEKGSKQQVKDNKKEEQQREKEDKLQVKKDKKEEAQQKEKKGKQQDTENKKQEVTQSLKNKEEKAPPKEEVRKKTPASIEDFCKQKLQEKLEKRAEAAKRELEKKLAEEAEAARKLLKEKLLKEQEAVKKALDELLAKEREEECKNKKAKKVDCKKEKEICSEKDLEKKGKSCKKGKKGPHKKFKFPCPGKMEGEKSCPESELKKSQNCQQEKLKNDCEKPKKTKLCVDSCNDEEPKCDK